MRPYDPYDPNPYDPNQSYGPKGQVNTYTGPASVNFGHHPDWGSIIQNDPDWQAARDAARTAERNAAATRRSDIRSALVRYGGDLSGFTDKYGDIDQATRDLAKQNQFSTLATLARSLAQNQRSMQASLAARGMLQSGELGYGQNQLDVGYGQERYNAANSLSDLFNNEINAYTGVLTQNARDMAAATQAARTRGLADPANKDTSGTADYDAGASAVYGKPVYVATDSAGNVTYYNPDGSELSDPYNVA